jgi:hypothetical protein
MGLKNMHTPRNICGSLTIAEESLILDSAITPVGWISSKIV